VIGVALVVVLISIVAYYIYESNRRGAVTLSNDLITAIDRRVGVQMHAYLAPAQQFLELADGAAAGRGVFQGGQEVEEFALRALGKIEPVTSLSYADPEGNFIFVTRNQKGSFDTKTIDRRNGGHRVTWARRDATGKVTGTEEEPSDTFDPRTRPWYQGADNARHPYWTDTYLFFTAQKPGITLAIPHYSTEGKLQTVMGVDIELATLCSFLKQLSIGVSGKAMIIDRDGRIVAYPSDRWLPADDPDAKPPRLDELDDPVLTNVYNRLRIEGYGRKILEIGHRRIIVSSEPVAMMTGRDWVVLIVVPETDFVGFVADSGWIALLMSIAVGVLVAALAGLLVLRSMQAERRALGAAARQQALETRTQTFIDLAHQTTLDRSGLSSTTESAATACAAKRVAVWRLSADGRTLLCEDCFDSTAKDHTSGLALHHDELPNLFAALAKGAPIDTGEAGRDRRTSELFALYLQPLEIKSVYITPIVAGGRLQGMLTVEDPRRGDSSAGLAAFCDALAILFALRFATADASQAAASAAPAAPVVAAPAEERPPDSFTQRQARLERTLLLQNSSVDALRDSAIDRAAVGVVKLPDWTSVAQRPSDSDERTAMDAIVHELRSAIEQSGVHYAALLDDQIVLAAFSPEKGKVAEDARCVATALLDLRDRLIKLEETWNVNLDFRLAVDVGTIMTSTVGTEPPSRNLWGGAIGIAKVLAATTGRHSITASETTYDVLSSDFLFRPRGSYFLPETGTMRTFVLVGRL
jgi:class 3 adenylate cyclase/GAF domain-containing protein